MRRITVTCLCLVLLPIVLSYPWPAGREGGDEDDDAIELFNNIQRRGWCARWGDFCVPDAKVKIADCCKGFRCVCGKFWAQAKCECKSQSAFGR